MTRAVRSVLRPAAILLVVLWMAILTSCADRSSSRQLPGDPCDSASTQLYLTACYGEAARRAELQVTEEYAAAVRAVQAKGVPELTPLLEESQRRWESYRDAHCEFARAMFSGGSLAPMVAANCRMQLAKGRVDHLKALYRDWSAR